MTALPSQTSPKPDDASSTSAALRVDNLRVQVRIDDVLTTVVDGVSFAVGHKRTLGIVGESGCGKSVTAMSILRLLPQPPFAAPQGQILLGDEDLLQASMPRMRDVRGNRVAMVFQEPMTSLNPVFTVGMQVMEGLQLHKDLSKAAAHTRAVELLQEVGIPDAAARMKAYPHELSGGMRQRVMIAIALACDPDVLIADEPTTALDVTIQAQIMDLLDRLQDKSGMSMVLITHDLGLVAESCDDVIVMYAGTVVEQAPVDDLFERPQHPYTQGLLQALPGAASVDDGQRQTRLSTIEGTVPPPGQLPAGCRFQDRCPHVRDDCRQDEPALVSLTASHAVRCVLSSTTPEVSDG